MAQTRQTISPPTYLRRFIDEPEIVFYFNIAPNNDTLKDDTITYDVKEESVTEDLDLTGNPLQVDLADDNSIAVLANLEHGYNWTSQETKYLPHELNVARNIINKLNDNGPYKNNLPVFCLCDGLDSQKVVMLGSHYSNTTIMTCSIKIIDLLHRDHELFKMENLKKEHYLNSKISTKVDYLISKKYFVYGYNLQGINNFNTEISGSVALEVTTKDDNTMTKPESIKMIQQLIVGHENSEILSVWQELCHLYKYFDILTDPDKQKDEETVINEVIKNECELRDSIHELLNTLIPLQPDSKEKLDVNNLRQEDILDKLWDILKYCNDLSTLRDCFTYFFEELAISESYIQFNESDSTLVARIASGILGGKVSVPTLSFSQSLELLYELGAEKLLNDYIAIINHFYSVPQDDIYKHFNKQSEGKSQQDTHRITRMTMARSETLTSPDLNNYKLNYLGYMHIAAEMILLVKTHVSLSSENFDSFCGQVYSKYLNDKHKNSFTEFNVLLNNRLVESTFNLRSSDNLIREECLDMWTVSMTSQANKFRINTAFNFSKTPIFPPNLFDKYSDVDSQDSFYVTKYVRHTHYLK